MDNHETPNSKYRNVLIAARRARQLQNGAMPTVDSGSQKACRVAQDEMAAGKLTAQSVGYRTASDDAKDLPDVPRSDV